MHGAWIRLRVLALALGFISNANAAPPGQKAIDDLVGRIARGDAAAVAALRHEADKGLAVAQLYLARLYKLGIGVRKDLVEMERLVRRSAKLGYRPAQYMVEAGILPSQVAATNAELRKQLRDLLLNIGQREPEPTERSKTEKQTR